MGPKMEMRGSILFARLHLAAVADLSSLQFYFYELTFAKGYMSSDQRRKTRFRPCIDIHGGKVKQIVLGPKLEEADFRWEEHSIRRH